MPLGLGLGLEDAFTFTLVLGLGLTVLSKTVFHTRDLFSEYVRRTLSDMSSADDVNDSSSVVIDLLSHAGTADSCPTTW